MPSEHTTNYSLSQWAKDDQVRMEDFNADNAKIDAALAELRSKSCMTLLMEARVTASAGVEAMSLDVSGVDWSQWQEVILDFCLPAGKAPPTMVTTGDVVCRLHVTSTSSTSPYITTVYPNGQVFRYIFYCFASPSNPILIQHPAYTSYVDSTSPFQDLKVIEMKRNTESSASTGTEKYLPGCWMKLYGVR